MDHSKEEEQIWDKRREMCPGLCSTACLLLQLWGRARGEQGLPRAECTEGFSHHCGDRIIDGKTRNTIGACPLDIKVTAPLVEESGVRDLM